MRVLIVEDDAFKSRQLMLFVESRIDGAVISTKVSYQGGLSEAVEANPDLIVLDMHLPNFDPVSFDGGYQNMLFAGRDILAELQRLGINTKVIVVTQFEQFGEGDDVTTLHALSERLQKDFPTLYRGTVYYHPAQEDWKSELGRLLEAL
jgi:DNA-binding NarL/FixJ family response regulator